MLLNRLVRGTVGKEDFVPSHIPVDYTACLAGNPNTGKSTVFNALTGLNQHTGNWPGKTVARARGLYRHQGKNVAVVDLPGTYSLLASSPEEEVARDFICFGRPDCTVVIVDATCLERNLNLVLQVLEITAKTVICLNLMDQAERRGFHIDVSKLSDELEVPIVPTVARNGRGLTSLKDRINEIASNAVSCRPKMLRYPTDLEAAIGELESCLSLLSAEGPSKRWAALRLLEGDASAIAAIKQYGMDSNAVQGV
ncbi:MAG: iron transporter FeoB [Firmicutes bacterium]|nr:iron transporter FeoB [Bacillota bacterium]